MEAQPQRYARARPHELSLRLRILASASCWIAYLIAFFMLFDAVGQEAHWLITLPVILTGYLFGFRAGLGAGLLAFPLNVLLSGVIQQVTLGVAPRQEAPLSMIVMIVAGAAVGRLASLSMQLEQQLEARREAELALRQSEQTLRSLVDQSPDGIVLIDEAGTIVEWNHGQEEITGLSRQEAVGRPLWDVQYQVASAEHKSPSGYEVIRARIVDFLQTGEAPWLNQMVECRARRPDGTQVIIQSLTFSIRKGRRVMAGSISRDVTRQRQADELTRRVEVAARMEEAAEGERRRLAQELHDSVGQNLTALGLNLSVMKGQALSEGAPKELVQSYLTRLDDAQALVAQVTQRVRSLMSELRPPVLDDYGLVAALRWYAKPFAERTGLRVDVEGEDLSPRLPMPLEIALFRIAQEALTNVAKHAQATMVLIDLGVVDGLVTLTVADDGVGFDPASKGTRRGWGLLTMSERAEAVGGVCEIGSQPGQGTQVIVRVPAPSPEAASQIPYPTAAK